MVKRQVHGHTYDALRAGLLFSMYMMGHVFFCFDSQDIRLPFLFFFFGFKSTALSFVDSLLLIPFVHHRQLLSCLHVIVL